MGPSVLGSRKDGIPEMQTHYDLASVWPRDPSLLSCPGRLPCRLATVTWLSDPLGSDLPSALHLPHWLRTR